MAQLVVHDLDEDTEKRLQKRAAQHGHSMEEEVRDILRTAAATWDERPPSKKLGTRIAERFVGLGLTSDLPELRGQVARPAELGDE